MSHDSQLKQSVLDELKWEPSIDAAHIGVTAKDGVIALMGHVENFSQKRAAERAAGRVKGVKAVAEEIEVRLPFNTKRGDEEIAAAAIERLAWDVSVPKDAIKVKIEKGWVTLTGQVDWHYQKEAAEQDIRGLHGVVGVSNQATIKSRVNTVNLSDAIGSALHRSWFFDSDNVMVSADGGKVKLSGTVESWHDREVAESTAWAAPGATSVENNIMIS
ncbi:MAG: BON domain-containing protein [Aestuariivirga sp.]